MRWLIMSITYVPEIVTINLNGWGNLRDNYSVRTPDWRDHHLVLYTICYGGCFDIHLDLLLFCPQLTCHLQHYI